MADNIVVRRGIKLYIDNVEIDATIKSVKNQIKLLSNELEKNGIIGSEAYVKQEQKLKELKAIVSQHQAAIKGVSDEAIRSGGSLTKWQAGIAGFMGGIASQVASSAMGMVYSIGSKIKEAAQYFNDYQEKVDNLGSLTGLAGDNLKWFGDQAKEMSVSTLEGSIQVKTAASAIVDGFTLMGSARPELLKNKESLKSVTEEAIILAEAAKIDLAPAVSSLGMVLNQFNAPASDARRIINALAAGSLVSAGKIPYLTSAIEKSGTVASAAGMSYEELIGVIETLAPRVTEAGQSGTQLRNVILRLQGGASDTNPAVVGFAKAIENLGNKHLSAAELIKLFGLRSMTAAKILINNQDETKRYITAVTGSNVAIEQATVNTNNNNGALAHHENVLANIRLELGERLAPALILGSEGLSGMGKALIATIKFFEEYKGIIIPATLSLIAYTTAVKAVVVWEKLKTIEWSKSLILSNLNAIAIRTQILLTGESTFAQKRALVATRELNAAVEANPWGLALAAIVAVAAALYMYSQRVTAAQAAQKMMNDVNAEAKKSVAEQKIAIETLVDIAQKESNSHAVRLQAIKKLNEISPEYLGNLTLESIKTDGAKRSIDMYIESLEKVARVEAAKQKMIELEKAMIDLKDSGKGAEISFLQQAGNGILAFGNVAQAALRNAGTGISNYKNKQDEIMASQKKLRDFISEDASLILPQKKSPGKDPIKIAEEKQAYLIKLENLHNEAIAEMQIVSKDREIAIEKAAAAKKLLEITGNTQMEQDIKEEIIAASNRKINDINAKYAMKDKDAALQIKLSYFNEIIKGAQVNSAEYVSISLAQAVTEREIALNQKNLTEAQKFKIEEEYSQKVRALKLTNMTTSLSIVSDSINQEEDRYTAQAILDAENNKFGYENRKKILDIEEQKALTDAVNTHKSKYLIETEFNDKRKNLAEDYYKDLAGKIQQYSQYAAEAFNSIDQILQNQEKRQLNAATKDHDTKVALLKKQLASKLISQADYDTKVAALDADLDKKKRKIEHDQAVRAKIAAVFQAGINIAVAITENLWNPLMVAIIAALGALQMAAIISTPVPGYADGGFTSGDKTYRAGEKGQEYIAPNDQVEDPITGPMIRMLNDVRIGKLSKTALLKPATPAFSTLQKVAGFASQSSSSSINTHSNASADNQGIKDLHETTKKLVDQNQKLLEYLTDPNNRRAILSRDLMTRFDKEEAKLRELAQFKG